MTNRSDLTQREMEILQLVLNGKTNKEIARKIYICEKTVEFHLDHIYTKIGVQTRLMAGIWAIEPRPLSFNWFFSHGTAPWQVRVLCSLAQSVVKIRTLPPVPLRPAALGNDLRTEDTMEN
jgi:DNA-binding CsgD family transcriptional regulator